MAQSTISIFFTSANHARCSTFVRAQQTIEPPGYASHASSRSHLVSPPRFGRDTLTYIDTIIKRCGSAGDVVSGTVKWFDVSKGYGFITPSEGGKDIFVHQTEIHAPGFRSLADGEEVKAYDAVGRLSC